MAAVEPSSSEESDMEMEDDDQSRCAAPLRRGDRAVLVDPALAQHQ